MCHLVGALLWGGRRVCALIVLMNSLSFLAGLKDVPEGAVCLSASQVLAFGQAAVRLERTHSRAEGHSLSRRKLYMSVVCLFAVVS